MTDTSKVKKQVRLWILAPLVVIVLGILLALGTWQVQRMHWKETLLADIEARRMAAAVSLVDIEAIRAQGGDIEYRTVRVSGVFDHARERHFFATHQGRTGFYVYTPLTLADGRILFVNRGFVPYEMKDAKTRVDGEVAGTVTIDGLARERLTAKPSSLVPDNDIAANIFYWKDMDAMVSSAGLDPGKVVPFFVDADAASNPGGWPQGGVTLLDLPNNHLQYAITWYGLAVTLVIVAGFAYFRRTKAKAR